MEMKGSNWSLNPDLKIKNLLHYETQSILGGHISLTGYSVLKMIITLLKQYNIDYSKWILSFYLGSTLKIILSSCTNTSNS